MITIKRAYEPVEKSDGIRFLVDQLWPRGLKKEALHAQAWLKEVAPSTQLRKWFAHDPARWREFQRRYSNELNKNPTAWKPLLQAARENNITLVYSAHDTEHNNAVVLKKYLEKKLASKPHKPRPKLVSV